MSAERPKNLQPRRSGSSESPTVFGELACIDPEKKSSFYRSIQVIAWAILVGIVVSLIINVWNPSGTPVLVPPSPGTVMDYSAWTGVALTLLSFQVLMRRIPESLTALWTNEMLREPLIRQPVGRGVSHRLGARLTTVFLPLTTLVARQTSRGRRWFGPKSGPEEHSDADRTQQRIDTLELQYCQFIRDYQRWLTHKGQWVVGGSLLLLVVFLTMNVAKLPIVGSLDFYVVIGQYPIAFLLGIMAWRLLASGVQTWRLGRTLNIEPQPGNVDRAGGLAAFGNLCLWNALIASLLGIYLGGWLIVAVVLGPPENQCDERSLITETGARVASYGCQALFWKATYLKLLLVPTGLALFGLVAPVWSLHQLMAKKRHGMQRRLLELGRQIHYLEQELLTRAEELETGEFEQLTKRLELTRETHRRNSHFPVWPYNSGILLKFGFAQAVPVLSVALNIAGVATEVTPG